MSILYGFVNLDGAPADPSILENMGSALAGKKTDAHSALIEGAAALGFFNQYITEESHYEKQPYSDSDAGLYCICDAILDNRDELAGLLDIRLTKELSDGRIIFEAYRKWGKDCTRYLLGDFAFVIFDSRRRSVQLFRDHVGIRLLYYRLDGCRVYFSSLIKPLIDPWGKHQKPAIDEKYLVHFLSTNEICQEFYSGCTIYNNISYVLPASCLIISGQSVTNEIYWDPLVIRPDRQLKKTDYVEEFKTIFFNAVRCRLRTTGDVGINLSGGLDSSSVACVAALILRNQNKELFTYTSVPSDGFTDWTPRQWNPDESDLVKTIHAAYPNMKARFLDSEGRNSLNVADRILELNEQPYKYIENSYWTDEITQLAVSDGCKVLIGGIFGNTTISYGTLTNILLEHLTRFHWIRFIQDFNAYAYNNKISRRRLLSSLRNYFVKSIFLFDKRAMISGQVKSEYKQKFDVEKNLRAFGLTKNPLIREKNNRRMLFHPAYLQQCYSMNAKQFYSSGVCMRDPTSDKNIIEFCMRLSYDCYFDKTAGQDRGLIKRAMTGIVPDNILNDRRRGLQAADWLERLEPRWNDFIRDFNEKLKQPNRLFEYLDLEFVNDMINQNEQLTYSFDTGIAVRSIIVIHNCIKFLNAL